MFFTAFLSGLLAASLGNSVLAELVSNVVFSDGLGGPLDQGLMDNLHPPGFTLGIWAAGWIPQDCKDIIEGQNLTATDVETWNVHYNDCSDPWVMCVHNAAPLNRTTMIDLFGRLPVRMRTMIRHLVAFPGDEWAANSGDNLMFSGDVGRISVFAHEVGHSIDVHGYASNNDTAATVPFHESSVWLDSFAKDSAVADAYADTDQAENHSQEIVVALFDSVVPGGLETVTSNWTMIAHQYATIQGSVGARGDTLAPGGTCEHRHNNSAPVRAAPGSGGDLGPAPAVSLNGSVAGYKFVPMAPVVNATVLKGDGQVGHREVKVLK